MTPGNLSRFLAGLATIPILSGCLFYQSPVVPYTARAINNTGFPVDITFNKTNIGTAQGSASAYSILFGLIAFGDCSVQSAARNGNIRQIDQIDAKLTNILTIYVQYKTVVSGKTQADLEKAASSERSVKPPHVSRASLAVRPGPS